MGAYTAFLDLTLGFASPALGWIAGVADSVPCSLSARCRVCAE